MNYDSITKMTSKYIQILLSIKSNYYYDLKMQLICALSKYSLLILIIVIFILKENYRDDNV